jgi:uncharacterized protein (DUF697 family)
LQQKQAIRFSYDDRSTPSNPFQADAATPTAPQPKPGVQPAVNRPGQRVTPPPAAAPNYPTRPDTYPTRPDEAPVSFAPSTPPVYSSPSSYDSSRPPFAALEEDPLERAHATVRSFSLWAAGIVLFPVPFSELVLLIPVQTAMILSLARIFGVQDPPEKILAYIAATSGVSVFGQVTMLIVINLFPFVGKLVGAPFIYGWTYGLGEVAIRYFQSQGQITGDEMKAVFKQASSTAHKTYSKDKHKVGKEESLNALRDHLSPEEYERLRNKFGTA